MLLSGGEELRVPVTEIAGAAVGILALGIGRLLALNSSLSALLFTILFSFLSLPLLLHSLSSSHSFKLAWPRHYYCYYNSLLESSANENVHSFADLLIL